MTRKYTRQYVQRDGRWAQKRGLGKAKDRDLCHACALFHPENDDTNCKRAIGMRNFCAALDMAVVVWECPVFEESSRGQAPDNT